MSNIQHFDAIVIGGGPGGYVAALRLSQLGKTVACVEKSELGGVCLNWGCIPTKSLLHSSQAFYDLKKLKALGIHVSNPKADITQMVNRSRRVADKLKTGVTYLLKQAKVKVFAGHATFKSASVVEVKLATETLELSADDIIIATGASPKQIAGLEHDEKLVWSHKSAMTANHVPDTLLVVGSGAIGIEFASYFNDLGTEVTVVEIQDRILPNEDQEISALAEKALSERGIRFLKSSSSSIVGKNESNVSVEIYNASATAQEKTTRVFDRVLVSAGIVGNIKTLEIEKLGMHTDNGHITTDDWGQTNVPGIWAIGDVTNGPWLAHKASHEGVVVAEKIASTNKEKVASVDLEKVPACTYCQPQIASVGLSEQSAIDKNIPIRVGRFPFSANGKAIASGKEIGLVKTVFHKTTGELLGAHIMGDSASEMIHGFVLAMNLETTEEELMASVFPHPTLSESMHESVLNAFEKALHI